MILTRIWEDDDFVALPYQAQYLYFLVISQPLIAATGVIAFTPRRWMSKSAGWTTADFRDALRRLEDARFVILDRDTEELLVRSYVKNDGVLDNPKVLIKARSDFQAIASKRLRADLVEAYPEAFAVDHPIGHPIPHPIGHPIGDAELVGDRGRSKGLNDSSTTRAGVESVWGEYEQRHPRARLTRQRQDLIRRRLADYPVEDLVDAVRGNHLDPHCNGDNDRGAEYHDLELILRDAAHVERYRDVARNGAPQARRGKETTSDATVRRVLERIGGGGGATGGRIGEARGGLPAGGSGGGDDSGVR